jgi:chromosome segregation ATPase
VRLTWRARFSRSRAKKKKGPNGTGKSSVVCGIGLALAGKPKVLGRAKTVNSFVRSGCNSGSVEVELFRNKPRRNVIIRREIFMNGQSVWYLNGRRSTEEAVLEEVAALNVQVNNLCQFLAQDRVKEFAKMTPVQVRSGKVVV